MRNLKFLLTAFAVLAIAFVPPVPAQGPPGDEVKVKFDRDVQVGSYTLAAGEYTVRQVTSASNPRVLEFTTDNGTKLQATVTAIPIMQNTPPNETKVILDEEAGIIPRVHRIWVQGRTYGYEIPGKGEAAAATNALSLEARYEAAKPAEAPVVAQSQPEPTPTPTPAPVEQAPPPQPTPTPQAQEPAPPPTPTPAPEEPAPAPSATPEVPSTALGFAPLMLLGLLTASAGLMLFRKGSTNTR